MVCRSVCHDILKKAGKLHFLGPSGVLDFLKFDCQKKKATMNNVYHQIILFSQQIPKLKSIRAFFLKFTPPPPPLLLPPPDDAAASPRRTRPQSAIKKFWLDDINQNICAQTCVCNTCVHGYVGSCMMGSRFCLYTYVFYDSPLRAYHSIIQYVCIW